MVPATESRIETLPVPGYVQRLAVVQYERGRQLALAGRLLEVDRVDLDALADAARTDARLAWRPYFDPAGNPTDRSVAARHADIERALDQVVKAERFLLSDVSEAALNFEAGRAGLRPPEIPAALLVAFMAVFAATVAPTLHDNIFYTLDDELLNWCCSFVIAASVGVAVVMAIFTASRLVPDQRIERGIPAAGILISVGLAILRAANARETDELALAVGLMIVEIGVVVCADAVAARYRKARALADAQQTQVDKAERTAEALRADLNEMQRRKRELAHARDELDQEIAERAHPAIEVTELEAVAVNAAFNGYRIAITENVGRMARTGGASCFVKS